MKNKHLFTFIMAIIMIFSVCMALPAKISVPLETSASGIDNIAARANYLYNTTWTAQATVKGWRNNYTFAQGNIYHIPYGQPVTKGKYICWGVSVDDFLVATQNASSIFYTSRSVYNSKESTYYSMDCSALASYCWDLPSRTTTAGWANLDVTDYGKCTSTNVNKIQKGDALNYYGGPNANNHVVIVSDVIYDNNGNIYQIEITEQTPPETKRSYYTASELTSKYSSYTIYRYNKRDNVTPPPNVPDPNPPTYSNLTANKTMLAVGEEITFTASSDYATGFTIGIDNETSRYITQEMPNGQLTLTFNQPGSYSAYVTSYNSLGYVDSIILKFFVFEPCDFGDGKLVYISQTCSNLFMTADTGEFTGSHNVYGTEKNFQFSQIWKLKKQTDGSYRLLNMGNNQCMEVFGGVAANGTNISTYDETASFENQKFNFYYINGHYFISPVCTPCLVDMNPDGSHDVATYDYGDDWSSHQTFDITEVPKFISDNINRDFSLCDFGDEKLVYISQTCSNLFMTADTGEFTGSHNVYGTEKNFQSSQIWKLKKQTDGSYRLLNMGNNQCMEVFGGAAANGTNISTYDETSSFENQKFNFYYINGHYFISPVCTPCLVDMNPDGSHNVATYDYGDEWCSHQIFDITEVPKFISDNINRDFSICDFGDEKLVYISQTCSNLFMTADTGEFNGTHNVYGTEKNFQSSQIWKLKKQTDGSYKLLNMGNNQCMEVFGGAVANGTNISTYDETASFENQKFNFYYINGHYFISPVCTPCLVDMNPDGSHDVATYDYGDDWSSHQTFDITEVPEIISGDINHDLSVSIADAVLLQKWLLGISNTKLENWKAADLYEDDRLDVFDMIEMRKLIINSKSML